MNQNYRVKEILVRFYLPFQRPVLKNFYRIHRHHKISKIFWLYFELEPNFLANLQILQVQSFTSMKAVLNQDI